MENFRPLDNFLKNLVDSGRLPGVSCVVTRGSDVVYEGYHGYANTETGKKLDDTDIFRIYSMTKIPIFTLCMMLYERGAFLLDDPLSDYFPEWANVRKYVYLPNGGLNTAPLEKPILLKHVFSMAMGLPYGLGPSGENPTENAMCDMHKRILARGPYSLRDEIREAAGVPVAFEPGSHWMYGFGSELAAGLVELLTGKDIEQALKDELFEPLEMKHTGMRFFGDVQKHLCGFYKLDEAGRVVPSVPRMDEKHLPGKENMHGCPRIFSTAGDYAMLGMMLACGGVFRGKRIMGRKTIDLMRTNHLSDVQLQDYHDRMTAGYGYGLGVRTLMDPAAAGCNGSVGEFGWEGGSGPFFMVDPEEQLSMTLMYQRQGSDMAELHLKARNVVNGCL